MPTPSNTLWDETRLAALGTLRMIGGRRDAPLYFGDDLRALTGSLLALVGAVVLSLLLNAVLATMVDEPPPISSFESVISTVLTFLGQTGGTYGALRMLSRAEKFVPYLIADNWTSFYLSVVTALLGFVGLGLDITLLVVGIVTLVAKVNIARLVAELNVAGIVLILVAQLCGAAAALLVIVAVFGPLGGTGM